MRINENYWLLNVPVAHRGLWDEDIPENSTAAYENAAAHGYAIEIDLYQSTDGEIFSFHDKTLKRMTGEDGNIFDKTAEQLKKLYLNGTKYKIPTFDEVLEIAKNRAPLLIELKDQPNGDYVKKVVERLSRYDGEFAIQSFNPLYINKVKKLAPQFIRGILGSDFVEDVNFLTRYVVKNMNFNNIIKPDFISYRYNGLPLSKKKSKNLPVIAWTVTDQETADRIKPYVKNIIFENFIPE